MKILICTDGSQESISTGELVLAFKFPVDTHITVLGVSENINHLENLTQAMEKINTSLGSYYQIDRKIRNGEPIEEILSEAVEASYDLVAVGGGKSQIGFLHPSIGSITSKLARKLHTHFLVARNVPGRISKILFCVADVAQSNRTIQLGGSWVANTSGIVSILTVIPKEKADVSSGDTIVNSTSEQLLHAGVKGHIESRIRRGLIVEEVLSELTENSYDLLVVGAHYQPGADLWQGTLLDDVTDQLLNRSSCSVLII
jgi:nucleotide-binding universal stress UspA family protein